MPRIKACDIMKKKHFKEEEDLKTTVSYLDLAEAMLQSLKEQQRDIDQLSQAVKEQERFRINAEGRITRLEQKLQSTQYNISAAQKEAKSNTQPPAEDGHTKIKRVQIKDFDDLPRILFRFGTI